MNRDVRLFAPAAARNREPILGVVQRYLPAQGLVLEVASGSGEHIVHFAQSLSHGLTFQPSDPNAEARASIDAWVATLDLPRVLPALDLNAAAPLWPITRADVVICINMIHIAPWEATLGLMRGADRILPSTGQLILYGPFRRDGRHTAPSNAAFDADLQDRNPAWGVRDLEAVSAVAAQSGFVAPFVHDMPANNLLVVFGRSTSSL